MGSHGSARSASAVDQRARLALAACFGVLSGAQTILLVVGLAWSIEQLVACQVHVGHPAAGDLAMEFITPAENRRALSGHRDGFYPPGRLALIAALPLR